MRFMSVPDEEREQLLCQWMPKYKNDLMRMCTVLLADRALAEDAVQETFIKAYHAMDSFRKECSEKTWLTRIAVNTCRDMRRDRWFRWIDRAVTPEEVMKPAAVEEPLCGLQENVQCLPTKYKEVILLYYYQGMDLQEISKALGIGVSTVSIRLKQARNRLRIDLEGEMENAGSRTEK